VENDRGANVYIRYRLLTKLSRPVAEKMLLRAGGARHHVTYVTAREYPTEPPRESSRVCLPLSLIESGSDLRANFSANFSATRSSRHSAAIAGSMSERNENNRA